MGSLFENSNAPQQQGPIGAHTVRGEIMRVLFTNDAGDYSVLKLLTQDSKEITLVGSGSLINVGPGEEIEATGKWEKHKDWGRQFRARTFKSVLPSTNDGLVRYLASGGFPGIGPKTAERIVETFGSETIHIMDKYTSRLKEVPGLGKKRIAEIQHAWQEVADRREMDVFLQSLGIPNSYCNRIFRQYGDRTAAVIKDNPYRLANEIKGIGFAIADRIARKTGIELHNPFRLSSGINHTLGKLAESGHTCLPDAILIEKAAEILSVALEEAKEGLDRAVKEGIVIAEPSVQNPDMQIIYPTKFYWDEKRLAEKLQLLLNVEFKADEEAMDFINSNLNEEQEQAVKNAFKHKMSIITGGPGVGKTTTIDEIVKQARRRDVKVFLAAPTGRAAKRMSEAPGRTAKTIHRMLIVKEESSIEDEEQDFVFNEDKHLSCDLLIVDEVSMLDLALASRLFSAISPDTSVVLVGDKDQLPSVGPGAVLHDMLTSECIPAVKLQQVFRQAEGSKIITSAHQINAGQMPNCQKTPRDELTDFYWIEQQDGEKIEDLITHMMTERIPERFNIKANEIQVLTPMNKGLCGRESLNNKLQLALNDIHKTQFKLGERRYIGGDRVMQTCNNNDKKVFNGDLGYILDIRHSQKTFDVMYENEIVCYNFDEASELSLAYAITIHKSQGSEFPAVIIPVTSQHFIMLQRNLLYTGVTRARKLIILVGQQSALQRCVFNDRQSQRFTQLSLRLRKLLGK